MGTVLGAHLVYLRALPCGLIDRIGPRRGLLIAALIMGLSGLLKRSRYSFNTFLAVAIFGLGGL